LDLKDRMLGSLSEADDAVQEAWLRLSRSDSSGIANLAGWLTTVVARVCMDMLRWRRSRREDSLSAQLTEPVVRSENATDPEQEALLADSVGLAFLVVLDRLTPAERLAFVLHDLVAVSFDEITTIVGRSPDATRQLASRTSPCDKEEPRSPTLTALKSEGLSTPFSLPCAGKTSKDFSRCSTQTS
jgi:RNA polymerase sigma-70 factor (ECF subfamily)